jgi:hypothetical protein
MSKAEDRALEAYPIVISQHSDNCKEYDSNESDRLTFIEGYHQAEKDLELGWEDMRELYIIFAEVDVETELCKADNIKSETIGYYQEVLKRFKTEK